MARSFPIAMLCVYWRTFILIR